MHHFRSRMAGEMLERSEGDSTGMTSHKTPVGEKLETGLKVFHSIVEYNRFMNMMREAWHTKKSFIQTDVKVVE